MLIQCCTVSPLTVKAGMPRGIKGLSGARASRNGGGRAQFERLSDIFFVASYPKGSRSEASDMRAKGAREIGFDDCSEL